MDEHGGTRVDARVDPAKRRPVRPCNTFLRTRFDDVDLVIVREMTELMYRLR
jgi:isocitrate/isopropylmalate dehydrogenase